MSTFRYLRPETADGRWNMAVDAMLLQNAGLGEVPCLRLYHWSSPTLSLGYFQRIGDRLSHSASQSCSVVRRDTGGGAIVHHRELTYSLTGSRAFVEKHGIGNLYCLFHQSLAQTIEDLTQVKAQTCGQPTADGPGAPFLCFQRRAVGDLLIGEHKVGGSAQRRPSVGFLQHGSVLWQQSPVAPELPGIADLTGTNQSLEEFAAAWLLRLGEKLQATWQKDPLRDEELRTVEQLVQTKYGSTQWTQRR